MKSYLISKDSYGHVTVRIIHTPTSSRELLPREAWRSGLRFADSWDYGCDSPQAQQLAGALLFDVFQTIEFPNALVDQFVRRYLLTETDRMWQLSDVQIRSWSTYYFGANSPPSSSSITRSAASSSTEHGRLLGCRACRSIWRHHRAADPARPVTCPSCGGDVVVIPPELEELYEINPARVAAAVFAQVDLDRPQGEWTVSSVSCSWCQTVNAMAVGEVCFCAVCGHRADLPPLYCTCPRCASLEVDLGNVPAPELPPLPHDGPPPPPIRVSGRGLKAPVIHSHCNEQWATLRIDDEQDPEKWVELNLPLWYLRRLVQDVELKQETAPLSQPGPPVE